MAWFKRIFLFMMVNMLIVVTISLVLNLLGVRPYLTASGIDMQNLAAFCLVWGMGGAFISLGLSRIMAKWTMGVQIIDPMTSDRELQALVQTVYKLARGAKLSVMPQVGIYQSPEVNAFATGPTKNRALVAVSSGLLQRMDRDAVEGVLGHEIAHVANGDMVTMTLVQGIVNAFVMFFARIVAFAITNAMSGNRDERESSAPSPFFYSMIVMVLEIAFGLLGMLVVSFVSRIREFRADKGGAQLAGTGKMIAALESLKRTYEFVDDSHQAMATLKISSKDKGLMALFASHPSLDERIERLKQFR